MKKTFDAVKWMRHRREQIDKEDAGLTWEERKQKTRAAIGDDLLWQKLKPRVVSEPQQRQTLSSKDSLAHR